MIFGGSGENGRGKRGVGNTKYYTVNSSEDESPDLLADMHNPDLLKVLPGDRFSTVIEAMIPVIFIKSQFFVNAWELLLNGGPHSSSKCNTV